MSFLDQLQQRLGAAWPAIVKAREEAWLTQGDLFILLANKEPLDQPDTSIVVFGSLAREEWTPESDIDWTLLIDGGANPEHYTNAVQIGQRLKDAKYKAPGQTGVFGHMAFSHEIIHQIGGQDDTNRNTTQRILLLLESVPIGDSSARDRVLTATLQRYLEGDVSFVNGLGGNTVPRFLLNDIVRFWRTVAVDFAAKQRDRSGMGWGLRNAKLRMSRKLIFAAGLLICFDCHLSRPSALDDARLPSDERLIIWLQFLKERVLASPLEIVCRFLYDRDSPSARPLLDSYEAFLSLLADEESRKHLDNLRIEQAGRDPVFQQVRQMGHSFQDALTSILFDESAQVRELVRKYGIF